MFVKNTVEVEIYEIPIAAVTRQSCSDQTMCLRRHGQIAERIQESHLCTAKSLPLRANDPPVWYKRLPAPLKRPSRPEPCPGRQMPLKTAS
jgi:hypothetical protein